MPSYKLSSGLPSHPAGVTDKESSLISPLYRAINAVSQQLSASTGNVDYDTGEMAAIDQFTKLISHRTQKVIVRANEKLLFGALLTLSLSGGKIVASKADASTTANPAHAILDVPFGLQAGEYGEAIFLEGKSSGVAGTTFMLTYYLSTAGQIQATAPTAPGTLVQRVGFGLGSAGFYFRADYPV